VENNGLIGSNGLMMSATVIWIVLFASIKRFELILISIIFEVRLRKEHEVVCDTLEPQEELLGLND
jgi:hypothetical protein